RGQQTGLLTAIAALECMIRHRPNRTPTLKNAEFLPSLDGQIRLRPRSYSNKKIKAALGLDAPLFGPLRMFVEARRNFRKVAAPREGS
ncbi:MAG TPA: hypothetical protein VKS24_12515, partial [Bradyrhizobium sp.]|nr:hypothetical protein [Bradyrhizobium sp.]